MKQKLFNTLKKVLLSLSLLLNITILLLIFTPFLNLLYGVLEVKPQPQLQNADAIIILSSGIYSNEIPARYTFQRILHGHSLYKKGMAKKIIVCGGTYNGVNYASVMRNILVSMGVLESDILLEDKSFNTYENIKFARPILQTNNFNKTLLVTSSSHMLRAMAVAKKLKLNFLPAPVPCYEKKISHPGLRIRFVWDILREFAAIVYFKLRGWI